MTSLPFTAGGGRIEEAQSIFKKEFQRDEQLGYKVTANSLYRQCGPKTSPFYEKDSAASTRATGRSINLFQVHPAQNHRDSISSQE